MPRGTHRRLRSFVALRHAHGAWRLGIFLFFTPIITRPTASENGRLADEKPKNCVRPVRSDALTLRMKFDHEFERMNSARAGCLPVRPPNAFGSGILESRILRLSDLGAPGAPSFHCVNWADPRDNFVNGLLELSGLSSASDTYATVQQKADQILSEFQTKLQANSIRIPINEPTVSGTWWNAYKGVIDTAVAKGMKVIVAYWAYQNGMPNDATAFRNMWQVVVSAYQSNNLVYFDIHNEPYGYSGTAWNTAAAQWLTDFPNVPKGRVIVAGTGYDDNVVPVGSDSRFNGCLLQLHIYGFWHQDWTTQAQWTSSMNAALGSYSARTIVGEWGAPMTDGSDYSNTNTTGDAFRSYVRAVSDVTHNGGMGSCYWPGLRNGDSYSMTTLRTGSPLTLSVNSTSGLDRLHWAWGI